MDLEELTNDEYNFAPDVDLKLNNNYYEINIYGYNYYFAVNDLDVDHKVDILQLNGSITKDEITSLDPEHIILQEGNIDAFIQNGILVYQTDDEIYQYAPTLNKSFYYSFDKYNFVVEGNNNELSNLTIWSDSETLGLHHNSVENYLYRKSYYGDIENLYGDESYLTHTLPVSKRDLYTSKFITGLLAIFIRFSPSLMASAGIIICSFCTIYVVGAPFASTETTFFSSR